MIFVEDRQEAPVSALVDAAGWLQRDAARTDAQKMAQPVAAHRFADPNTTVLIEVVGGARVLLNDLLRAIEGDGALAARFGLDVALCQRIEALASDLGAVLGSLRER